MLRPYAEKTHTQERRVGHPSEDRAAQWPNTEKTHTQRRRVGHPSEERAARLRRSTSVQKSTDFSYGFHILTGIGANRPVLYFLAIDGRYGSIYSE